MRREMTQHNAVRAKTERGDVVFGASANTFSPMLIEVYGEMGLDFVWLDFEHGGPSPYDSILFEELTRAADVAGIELFVRLPSGDPSLIRKALDAGVRNLLVPRIDSVEDVERAVEATRFVYDGGPGQRGVSAGRATAWGTAENYADVEDESVFLGVMIEKPAAVDALDDILAVPELGFVFVGPGDLSVQLGHPYQTDHPSVVETVEEIERRSTDADVVLGGVAHSTDGARDAVDRGYQIIRIGNEVEAAREVLGGRLDRVRTQRK